MGNTERVKTPRSRMLRVILLFCVLHAVLVIRLDTVVPEEGDTVIMPTDQGASERMSHLTPGGFTFFVRSPTKKMSLVDLKESFYGVPIPEGNDRRNLHTSQYRAIYTYRESAAALDKQFTKVISQAGWKIENDERKEFVGKEEVKNDEGTVIKVTFEDYPESGMCAFKL